MASQSARSLWVLTAVSVIPVVLGLIGVLTAHVFLCFIGIVMLIVLSVFRMALLWRLRRRP